MTLRSEPAAAGPERRQHREFTLTCLAAREQQARDVGAGDEQHQPDGGLQHPDRSAGAAEDLVRERRHPQGVALVALSARGTKTWPAWPSPGVMPARAAQVSMSAFNSACADATVTPSFNRPMSVRLWLLRARRSPSVKPSGSQISGVVVHEIGAARP